MYVHVGRVLLKLLAQLDPTHAHVVGIFTCEEQHPTLLHLPAKQGQPQCNMRRKILDGLPPLLWRKKTPCRGRSPSLSAKGSPPRSFGVRIPLLQIDGQSALHVGIATRLDAIALALRVISPERRLRCGFGPGAPG